LNSIWHKHYQSLQTVKDSKLWMWNFEIVQKENQLIKVHKKLIKELERQNQCQNYNQLKDINNQ